MKTWPPMQILMGAFLLPAVLAIQFQESCRKTHNEIRKEANANALVTDNKLVAEAKKYAKAAAAGNNLQIPDKFSHVIVQVGKNRTCKQEVKKWSKDKSSPEYKQLVAPTASALGCAQKKNSQHKVIICLYRFDTATTTVGAEKPPTSDDKFLRDCLDAHNRYRRLHNAQPLKMDPTLNKIAQGRAAKVAAAGHLEHDLSLPYGENLAMHSLTSETCSGLVQLWYDEVKQYDFRNPGFNMQTGHFTQLVWKDTSRLGCGRAFGTGKARGVYLACNYDPFGNVSGEFGQNVEPASSQASSTRSDQDKRRRLKKDKKKATSTTSAPTTITATNTTTTTTTAKP